MIMKYAYLLGLLAFLFFAGCEDLEDTYDEYTGDGPINYLATCSDVTVESGWERLVVKWKNELDPNRNGIWIRCQSEVFQLDTVVPADSTSCNITGLADASYNITVAAISSKGDTSLTAVGAGRPYTPTHEAVIGFMRGIQKYIPIKDKLVLFMSTGSYDILEFALEYTDTEGNPQHYTLPLNPYVETNEVLDGVDVEQPVVLTRVGMLEGCADTIHFPDYVLDLTVVDMATDFRNALLERYGVVDLESEELEFDYDLSSLVDILYFPNLKTLKLGANRYYGSKYGNPSSELTQDEWGSMATFAIETLAEINPDFQVILYNYQYGLSPGWPECVVNGGNSATLPEDLQLLDTTGFVVTATTEGETIALGNELLDDDATTIWKASTRQDRRTHTLDIDMREVKTVKGLKIVQANPSTAEDRNLKPSSISVQVSVDGRAWTNPCHVEQNTLGDGNGEAKLLDFASEQNIRYIRLTVRDVIYDTNASCVLGDVLPY